jgi:hypothetical protein
VAAIVGTVVVSWLFSTALLYGVGAFNSYADVGGRKYVVARPDPAERLAYCTGLGAVSGIAVGTLVRTVGRNRVVRFLVLV